MVIFIEKFQYLVNGLRFGFYYGLRFRSNRFEHSVKRFGRFGLDTLVSRSQSMLGLLSKSQKTKILTISVKALLMSLLYKIHFKNISFIQKPDGWSLLPFWKRIENTSEPKHPDPLLRRPFTILHYSYSSIFQTHILLSS